MEVFARVEGRTIQGKAQYHDGTPAKNCDVRAFDPLGEEIGRTKTNEEGKFSLGVRFRCDYRLLVDAGDGHGGEYVVSGSLLPGDLPARGASSTAEPALYHNESEPAHSHEPQKDAPHADANFEKNMLADIHADVDQLQEQLNEYEHRLRWRDILGGIGFIVGLVGVAYGYYYRGLMQKNRQT